MLCLVAAADAEMIAQLTPHPAVASYEPGETRH
jgi:hypothetical protein